MKLAINKRVGEATLSGRGLVNLPARAVRELGWQAGDKLIVEIADDERVSLVRKPADYVKHFSGRLSDVFGTHDEILAYLDEERASWGPEER